MKRYEDMEFIEQYQRYVRKSPSDVKQVLEKFVIKTCAGVKGIRKYSSLCDIFTSQLFACPRFFLFLYFTR